MLTRYVSNLFPSNHHYKVKISKLTADSETNKIFINSEAKFMKSQPRGGVNRPWDQM